MTNGRGTAGMASLLAKKKKYKFQVEVCLEELLEVPFVSAVLFAKLRLSDGGNFQDHSTRQEVKDHAVKWGSKFTFPCKMLANASTGVLERCVLRISVRKECKGGKSFTKLGFVDINLAEYAGAGETSKKALLEGYDARHRQDNSLLKFSIRMHMLSGDILFKAPSPSKHKQIGNNDDSNGDSTRTLDELSSGSHAGSIASASSGFGSLTKKRPQLLSSELVIGPTLNEANVPVTSSDDQLQHHQDNEEAHGGEHGHSRNSSNTSQMSKASGYSSIHSHSHSRQSSSGDSGHIRNPSSSSLVLSETGSLDRAKAALEKRKKTNQHPDVDISTTVGGRVEETRVNPDHLIEELLKKTNIELTDESAESLQLFIAKDGTASLGNHEVKSQMSTGQHFKQVVMEEKR